MNNYSKITLVMIRNFDVAPEEMVFTLEGTNKVTENTPEVGVS